MTSFSIIGLLAFLICLAAPASASAGSVKKCLLLSYMLLSRCRIFTKVSKICFSTVLGMCPSSCLTPVQSLTIRQVYPSSIDSKNPISMCNPVADDSQVFLHNLGSNYGNPPWGSLLTALPRTCCRQKEEGHKRVLHRAEAVTPHMCAVTSDTLGKNMLHKIYVNSQAQAGRSLGVRHTSSSSSELSLCCRCPALCNAALTAISGCFSCRRCSSSLCLLCCNTQRKWGKQNRCHAVLCRTGMQKAVFHVSAPDSTHTVHILTCSFRAKSSLTVS